MANTPKKPSSKPAAKSTAKGSAAAAKNAKSNAAARAALKSAGGKRAAGKPGARAGKASPVTAKSRPWGLIAGALAVVVFAAVAVTYAVTTVSDTKAEQEANLPTKIEGVKNYNNEAAQHSVDDVSYPQTPPVGGTHNPEWADCNGTVYPVQIKNENAVHSLEHGAIWITYLPSLDKASVDKLKALVDGQDFMMMSPYPGQATPISLQSWDHQLQLSSASDPRIQKFIDGFRHNQTYTPEFGASCDNPAFKANPKVPGDSGAPSGSTDAPATPSADASASEPASGSASSSAPGV